MTGCMAGLFFCGVGKDGRDDSALAGRCFTSFSMTYHAPAHSPLILAGYKNVTRGLQGQQGQQGRQGQQRPCGQQRSQYPTSLSSLPSLLSLLSLPSLLSLLSPRCSFFFDFMTVIPNFFYIFVRQCPTECCSFRKFFLYLRHHVALCYVMTY